MMPRTFNTKRVGIGILCSLVLLVFLLAPVTGTAEAGEGAGSALEALHEQIETIERRFKDGETQRARREVQRLTQLIQRHRTELVEAAGEVAEEELAEIDEFLSRLDSALADGDTDQVHSILELIGHELGEIEAVLTRPAEDAASAIEDLRNQLETMLHEVEEGEFEEAYGLVERFEGRVEANKPQLVEAAGEVAEEELAEIHEFVERLEKALEAGNKGESTRILELIGHELGEIDAAITTPAGDVATALDDLRSQLETMLREVEEGEFDEAYGIVERFEGRVEANRSVMVEAAGEVAEEELAEIHEFVERLEEALENNNAGEVQQLTETILHELDEIGDAAGSTAAGPRVRLESVSIVEGGSGAVTLSVSALDRPLAAYQLTVRFDPSVVRVTEASVVYGNALPDPLIDNEKGTVLIQGIKTTGAQSGEITVARLRLKAIADSGQRGSIELSVQELADPDGKPIENPRARSGQITVKEGT